MELTLPLFILSMLTLTGFNFSFWVIIGLIRWMYERILARKEGNVIFRYNKYKPSDIGAIIPAHNEELTIARTITALLKVIPRENIYVASDYSTDNTNKIVKSLKVNLADIKPNKGKAKALVYTMKKFKLFEKYKLIMVNDADTEIKEDYLKHALPLLNDPEIAAVATHGVTRMRDYSWWGKYFIAYRIRLWSTIQIGMRFGQTWKYTNVSFIIPGSLSIYRTDVIKQLEIDAPGLIIEDFNMTFEVHKKKLGKIAYTPKTIGIHQDPYTLTDYIKQVQRWNVGFFQTVKRHGFWPSLFWFATTFYYIELLSYAIFLGIAPTFLILFLLNGFQPINVPFFYSHLRFSDFFIGIFFMDYLLTIVSFLMERKPMLLVYGFGFIFLRYVDSLIYLGSPIIALTKKHTGTWKSPKRL